MARARQEPLEPVLFVDLLDGDHDLILELAVRLQHNLIFHFEFAARDFVECQSRHAALSPAEDYVLAEHAFRIAHLLLGADDV